MLTVRTNKGNIPAEVVKTNNKTVLVKITNTVDVVLPGIEGGADLHTQKLVTKYIKRRLSDLQAI